MSTRTWLWRTAGLMSFVYCAYVALVAYVVGTLSVELFGVFDRPAEDPALAWGLFLALPMVVSALIVGLLIASPLVTLLVVLTVGLGGRGAGQRSSGRPPTPSWLPEGYSSCMHSTPIRLRASSSPSCSSGRP